MVRGHMDRRQRPYRRDCRNAAESEKDDVEHRELVDYILGFRTESKTLSARSGLGRFSATGADLLRSGNAVRQDRA